MKNKVALATPRTALLLSAAVLLANPAFGQDVPAPPPAVQPTIVVPQEAPVTQTAPQPAPPILRPTIVTPAPATESAEESAAPAARPAPARRTTTTRTTVTQRTERTPVRAEPAPVAAPVVAPAPVAEAPVVEVTPAPVPVTEVAPAETTTETTTTEAQGFSELPWILAFGGLLLLGIGLIVWQIRRSRRDEQEYYEEYVPSEPVVEPVAAAPVVAPRPAPVREHALPPELAYASIAAASAPPMMPDTAEPAIGMLSNPEISKPSAEDLAVVTGSARPEAGRPWLELALRPVRAGSTTDEALVELELTIGNAGNVRAEDVRVAAFMLPNASAGEMERLLVDPPADATLAPMAIEAGAGVEIDATLSVPKSALNGDSDFAPVVVADARYPLADGSEGRISASFLLGVANGSGELHPIELDRRLRDDIEARLHGALERA